MGCKKLVIALGWALCGAFDDLNVVSTMYVMLCMYVCMYVCMCIHSISWIGGFLMLLFNNDMGCVI